MAEGVGVHVLASGPMENGQSNVIHRAVKPHLSGAVLHKSVIAAARVHGRDRGLVIDKNDDM